MRKGGIGTGRVFGGGRYRDNLWGSASVMESAEVVLLADWGCPVGEELQLVCRDAVVAGQRVLRLVAGGDR